jgi:hypothetical protein
MVPDAGDTGGDRDTGQAPAVTECVLPDAGDAGADDDVGPGWCRNRKLLTRGW